MDLDEIFKQEVFEYLDDLRESGVANMFGAAEYIEDEFSVDREEARALLLEWMRTFSERHSVEVKYRLAWQGGEYSGRDWLCTFDSKEDAEKVAQVKNEQMPWLHYFVEEVPQDE